jgi:DNA-directed RNA polymerase specialized sigma24 family protein
VPWLFGVARNLLAAEFRAGIRACRLGDRLRAELRELEQRSPIDPASSGTGPSLAEIRWALGRLNEQDRELLMLAGMDGLTPSQISVATGLTAGAVRVRLFRAKQRLRRQLGAVPASPVRPGRNGDPGPAGTQGETSG